MSNNIDINNNKLNNSNEEKQVREFNIEINNNKKQCTFFNTKGGCKNKNCTFLHISNDNWRNIIKTELSPEEQISEEIKLAINNQSLNNIFKKMTSSSEDYNKFYWDLEKHFRGIAIWKLEKKSIKKKLISTISSRDVEIDIKLEDGSIDNGILPYGYIPLCLFFIFNGFTWNIFNGSSDNQSQSEIESCLDEIIDIISSMYSREEYKEIIKIMILYCNPETFATLGHISIGNACDSVLRHIKSELSLEEFEHFLSHKTKDDETCRDWFDYNKNKNDYMIKRYTDKFNRAIKYAKNDNEKLAKIKKIYEYNISTLNRKLDIINTEIFTKGERKKTIYNHVDVNIEFNDYLDKLILIENKYGIPYNPPIFCVLISLIKSFFVDTFDDKIKLILDKIPNNLSNGDNLINQFKEYGYITKLWKYTLNTISFDKPFSFCPSLLDEFFQEPNKGFREAYIGEYIHKTLSLIKDLSEVNKLIFFKNINSSFLSDNIKCKLTDY